MDQRFSLLIPQRLDRASVPLISLCCQGIARLKPDLSLAQASADVDRMIPMAPARFRLNPGASATGYKNARIGPNSRFLKDELVGDIGRTRLARDLLLESALLGIAGGAFRAESYAHGSGGSSARGMSSGYASTSRNSAEKS